MGKGEYEIMGAEEVIVRLIGKVAFSEEEVRKIVEYGRQKKMEWIKAYNLCDGENNQTEIAKRAKVNEGDLSGALKEWENKGIIYKVKFTAAGLEKICPKGIMKIKEGYE